MWKFDLQSKGVIRTERYKPDWEQAKKRLEAFWRGELTDRCCVAATGRKEGGRYQNFPLPESQKDREIYWTDAEQIIRRNRDVFENTFYAGEAFPQIFLNLGASGLAGYFKGIRVGYTDTVWFFGSDEVNGEDPESIVFDRESFLYRKTIELSRAFVEDSGGEYFVSMPDISGNMDTLAHLRGSDNFLMDLILNPGWVHAAMPKCLDVWKTAIDECYAITKDVNDGGSTVGWLGIWGPGKFSQMQCDLSVMISHPLFEEFVVPELRAQAAYLDRSLYHFDGQEQALHLDSLLAMDDLDVIQWTCVDGQPEPTEFIPTLKKIQQAGKRLLIRHNKFPVLERLLTELSSKGLFLYCEFDTEDEAKQMIRLAEKLCHE